MEMSSVFIMFFVLIPSVTYLICGCVCAVTVLCIVLVSSWLLSAFVSKSRVDPTGKAVFITGCGSGFGKTLAIRLDGLGFQVFAGCLHPDQDGAEVLRKTASSRLHIVPLDVTDDFQVNEALQYVKHNLHNNQLWAVVNNAGVSTICELEWTTIKDFQDVMDVNAFGVVRVTKAFLPLLRKSEGRVINMAGLAGRFSLPRASAFSMSKSACVAFSDCLRQEMRRFNISVVTVEPGIYRTSKDEVEKILEKTTLMWEGVSDDIKADYGKEYFEQVLSFIPIWGRRARTQLYEVIDCMEEAVCVDKPQLRYVPHTTTRIQAFIFSFLPTTFIDRYVSSWVPARTLTPRRRRRSSVLMNLRQQKTD